jgi:hypothetical protein
MIKRLHHDTYCAALHHEPNNFAAFRHACCFSEPESFIKLLCFTDAVNKKVGSQGLHTLFVYDSNIAARQGTKCAEIAKLNPYSDTSSK